MNFLINKNAKLCALNLKGCYTRGGATIASGPGIFKTIRHTWMRKNSFFIASIFAGAIVTEILVDAGIDAFWQFRNRGVNFLQKGIIAFNLFFFIFLLAQNKQ